jgi:hypothetical protein
MHVAGISNGQCFVPIAQLRVSTNRVGASSFRVDSHVFGAKNSIDVDRERVSSAGPKLYASRGSDDGASIAKTNALATIARIVEFIIAENVAHSSSKEP